MGESIKVGIGPVAARRVSPQVATGTPCHWCGEVGGAMRQFDLGVVTWITGHELCGSARGYTPQP